MIRDSLVKTRIKGVQQERAIMREGANSWEPDRLQTYSRLHVILRLLSRPASYRAKPAERHMLSLFRIETAPLAPSVFALSVFAKTRPISTARPGV